jgi:hypothetical protein
MARNTTLKWLLIASAILHFGHAKANNIGIEKLYDAGVLPEIMPRAVALRYISPESRYVLLGINKQLSSTIRPKRPALDKKILQVYLMSQLVNNYLNDSDLVGYYALKKAKLIPAYQYIISNADTYSWSNMGVSGTDPNFIASQIERIFLHYIQVIFVRASIEVSFKMPAYEDDPEFEVALAGN